MKKFIKIMSKALPIVMVVLVVVGNVYAITANLPNSTDIRI